MSTSLSSPRPESNAGTGSGPAKPDDPVAGLYDPLVEDARQAFHGSRVVRSILYGTLDPVEFEALLIAFCALGVQMTAPVADWIERSGRACLDQGHHVLGLALIRHASHEAGHEKLMTADALALVNGWNDEGGSARPFIDPEKLLATAPTEGIENYVEVHESAIVGDSPFVQIAIEYEIEQLSISLGAALLERISTLCRPGILDQLSFLSHHVELDEGHTVFNRRQLTRLLQHHPRSARSLAQAGSGALDAYRVFLADCHRLAIDLMAGHGVEARS